MVTAVFELWSLEVGSWKRPHKKLCGFDMHQKPLSPCGRGWIATRKGRETGEGAQPLHTSFLVVSEELHPFRIAVPHVNRWTGGAVGGKYPEYWRARYRQR